MQLSRLELDDHAEFIDDSSFRLKTLPFPAAAVPLGLYELPRRSGDAHLYRLNHPLAEALLAQAKSRSLASAEIYFNYGRYDGKVSQLEPFIGKAGWLTLSLFSIESLEQAEDHLIFAASTDEGEILAEELAARLFTLPGSIVKQIQDPPPVLLETHLHQRRDAIQRDVSERNGRFFAAEADKLDSWADDLKAGLEREIKEIDRQIKEARQATSTALTLEEKLVGQKQIRTLEFQRNQKRRSLFEAQDEVDRQRDELIVAIEGKLQQRSNIVKLFTVRWVLKR